MFIALCFICCVYPY